MQPIHVFLQIICLLLFFTTKAQDVLLLNEDFESGGASFTINSGGVGANSGSNQWIVNDIYDGAGVYPNTTTQDNTNGGTISYAPTSTYLHIHDQPSGILNANYNPTVTSDRFAYLTSGLCTYGMEDIHFSFFWLSEGSAGAFGKIYYSLDNGPWIQFGQPLYNNNSIWQYSDITDPSFSDVGSLRFGFRWENGNSVTPFSQSFSIDDVTIVGSYSTTNPVTITVTSIFPTEVCQGGFVTMTYELSDTLCDGTYQIELSNSVGNFTGIFNSWVIGINYPQTTGSVTVQLPANAGVGDCYKFRINRLSPPPEITGTASGCFSIIDCPNVINTLQPVVTLDTNAVCIGSVIDVPFTSTGIYAANNDYIAQLSEPDGTFSLNPPIVGTFDNNQTYDPNLGQLPGSVSGLIPPVVPGCGYYIRVISTNPDAIGTPWGPFCIQECDITTNNMQDLDFCVNTCAIDPDGENEIIDIDVNTYDNVATYLPGNEFTTQLLSSMSFAQIGSNGILGSVAATNDTTLNVHIPCKDSLPDYGIPLGMNYMRIVATNSTEPENALGSLIHLTIGAYSSEPQVITAYTYPDFIEQDVFCVGETVALFFQPYDYFANSTYMWDSNGINGGQPFVSPSGPNSNSLYVILGGTGTLTFSVQETNYGCVSPWSPIKTITVLGNPNANISGPSTLCTGELATFDVNFYPNTYYSWTTNAPESAIAYQDTSNNEMNIIFDEPGDYTLEVNVLNLCGSDSDEKDVTVLESPVAVAGNDTTICTGQTVTLINSSPGGNALSWSNGTNTISNTSTLDVSPDTTTSYIAVSTGLNDCSGRDTVTVFVEYPDPPTIITDSLCPGGLNQLNLYADTVGIYLWSTNETESFITVHDTGFYELTVTFIGEVCPHTAEYTVLPLVPEPPTIFTDSICPGGGNQVLLTAVAAGNYLWSTGSTDPYIIAGDTGVYTVQIYNPAEVCEQTEQFILYPLPIPGPALFLTDSICPGSEFPLSLMADVPGIAFEWNTGQDDPLIHVNDTGIFVLTIFMEMSPCPRTLYWTITDDTCYTQPELYLYVPNVFTPDYDGINDVFGPVFSDISQLRKFEMRIFNRWGDLIFETFDPEFKWTGNIEGGEHFVPNGAYVWEIEYETLWVDDTLKEAGHVIVAR